MIIIMSVMIITKLWILRALEKNEDSSNWEVKRAHISLLIDSLMTGHIKTTVDNMCAWQKWVTCSMHLNM